MKVFVFGGTGFIGSALCRRLVERHGFDVTAVDGGSIEPETKLPPDVDVIGGSVNNIQLMRHLIESKKPDVIYWLAAVQGYGANYSKFAKTNIGGIYTLFEALDAAEHRPSKIILASSQAVYSPGLRVTESSNTVPFSVYGESKLQQEYAMRWFCLRRDIPLVALRYSIVLGAGQSMQVSESGMLRNWYRDFKRDAVQPYMVTEFRLEISSIYPM